MAAAQTALAVVVLVLVAGAKLHRLIIEQRQKAAARCDHAYAGTGSESRVPGTLVGTEGLHAYVDPYRSQIPTILLGCRCCGINEVLPALTKDGSGRLRLCRESFSIVAHPPRMFL